MYLRDIYMFSITFIHISKKSINILYKLTIMITENIEKSAIREGSRCNKIDVMFPWMCATIQIFFDQSGVIPNIKVT